METPRIPPNGEAMCLTVADLTGMELNDVQKQLKLQLSKGWDKTSEATREAWWKRFLSGQIEALKPKLM